MHGLGALVHPGHRPPAATDVEQRHGDEVDGLRPELPHPRGHRQQGEEVVVGQHHALRAARRAARVELEGDVVRSARRVRIDGLVGADPLVVVLELLVAADHEDRADRRQRVGDGVQHRHEVGSDDEHLGLGVVDDELDLRRREAPVDVDADGVGERRAEEHLEVLDAVLVEEGDAVLRTDARPRRGRRPPGRPARTARPTSLPGRRAPATRRRRRSVACVRRMSPMLLIAMGRTVVPVTDALLPGSAGRAVTSEPCP